MEVPSRHQSNLIYTVVAPQPEDPLEEFVCTCPSFNYRSRCIHQEMAYSDRCLWDEETGSEQQTPTQQARHICPRCGNETYVTTELIDE